MVTRSATETSLLRVPGTRYIENADGTISNLYNFKIYNKTNHPISAEIRLLEDEGTLKFAGTPDLTLEPTGLVQGTLFITLPAEALKDRKNIVRVGVFEEGQQIEALETTFMAPNRH